MAVPKTFPFYRKSVTNTKISYYKIVWFNPFSGFKTESYSFSDSKVTRGLFKAAYSSVSSWEEITEEEFNAIEETYEAINLQHLLALQKFCNEVTNQHLQNG